MKAAKGCRAVKRRQRGAMAVEFGLVALLLFTTLIATMEVGRLLWTWNAAADATRVGARVASVCDIDDTIIKQRMRQRLPVLSDDHISVTYTNPGSGGGGGCTIASCVFVTVELQDYEHELLVPLPSALRIRIPAFTTTVPRENMSTAANVAACS